MLYKGILLSVLSLVLMVVFICKWIPAFAGMTNLNGSAQAETTPQSVDQVPPIPQGLNIYITDPTGLINPSDRTTLQNRLQALDEAGIAQIAILILPDTNQDLSAFAPMIMNQWGIQHHGKKDGLLILVNAQRLRHNVSGNRIFVATGLNLEEKLPDSLVGRVLDEKAIPAFRQGDYSAGITQTALTLSDILQGNRSHYQHPIHSQPNWMSVLLIVLFLLIFFGRGGGLGFFGGALLGSLFGGGDDEGGGFGGGFGGGGDSSGGGGAGR